MDKKSSQLHHLAPKKMKNLSVRKKEWSGVRSIHLETVEIAPDVCCFEWEGDQDFQVGDELNLHFDFIDGHLIKRAAILSVDQCKFLDEGYEQKNFFLYCARFDGELDPDFFREIAGSRRRCKSFFKVSALEK